MILKFEEYINESFKSFTNALHYDDWSNFEQKLKYATEAGFTDEQDLIEKMGMDYKLYKSIQENMIYNWIDSTSKSILLGLQDLGLKIPKKGDQIFRTAVAQTRFVVICGPGFNEHNVWGSSTVHGLRLYGYPSIIDQDGKSYMRLDQRKDYSVKPQHEKTINDVLRYVWIYQFYHDHKIKADKIKLPKALYRGIRISNINDHEALAHIFDNEDEEELGRYLGVKKDFDRLTEYIVQNGISEIMEGTYLSFTANYDVAKYFAGDTGIVVKVDPKKVRIISSELTEPMFKQRNNFNNRFEKEFVIQLPDDYKFKKEDISIVSLEYYIGCNSPLAVQFFDHNNIMARYKLNGKEIEAKFHWNSKGTKGSIDFVSGEVSPYYYESRARFKKEAGFDPMPTTDNLHQITDFELFQIEPYSSKPPKKIVI